MELSIFVAKIIAIVYLSAGIGAVSKQSSFKKMIEGFEKSPVNTYMAGLLAVIVGMLLVEYHNIWVKDWTVLITIIGWAALLKGILFIAFPKIISYFKGLYEYTVLWGVVLLAIGLLFGYFGFVM